MTNDQELPQEVKAHLDQRSELNRAFLYVLDSIVAKQRLFNFEDSLKYYLKESKKITEENPELECYLRETDVDIFSLNHDEPILPNKPAFYQPSPIIQPISDEKAFVNRPPSIHPFAPKLPSRLSSVVRDVVPINPDTSKNRTSHVSSPHNSGTFEKEKRPYFDSYFGPTSKKPKKP